MPINNRGFQRLTMIMIYLVHEGSYSLFYTVFYVVNRFKSTNTFCVHGSLNNGTPEILHIIITVQINL